MKSSYLIKNLLSKALNWTATESAFAAFRTIGFLPLPILQILGVALGWLLWLFPGRYKLRSQINYLQAYPASTINIGRKVLVHMAKMYLELPYLWSPRNSKKLSGLIKCDDWSMIDDAISAGDGLILLSAHIGSYEAVPPFFCEKYPATVLYKLPKHKWLRDLISKIRLSPKLDMVPTNQSGITRLTRTLAKGGVIGLLVDHTPKGSGVSAPFFGKLAFTTTLVQRMQSVCNSPIFMIGLERLDNERGYYFHIMPFTKNLSETPEKAAAELNLALEKLIRMMPEQYLWGYNRYKYPENISKNGQPHSANQ